MIKKVKVSNILVSELVYGVWRLADDKKNLSNESVLKKIQTCLDLGITSFDHADIYGNYSCEEIFGLALNLNPSIKKEIQIITKCGIMLISDKKLEHKIKHYNTSKNHIKYSVENSLKKIGVEKIDLLLIHRPDPLLDAEEVASIFDELILEGKVLSVGVSNFTVSQFQLLNSKLKNKLVTNQVELSITEMKAIYDGTLDQCSELNIRPMAWSPTAGGKIFTSLEEKYIRVRNKLLELHKKYNCTIEELCFAWILNLPSKVIPIIGTTDLNRIQNIAKSTQIKLEKQDWFSLWVASMGKEVP